MGDKKKGSSVSSTLAGTNLFPGPSGHTIADSGLLGHLGTCSGIVNQHSHILFH